jgi:hypothetical protein
MLKQIETDVKRAEVATPSDWDTLMKTTHLQECSEHNVLSFQMACLAATLIERGESLPPPLRLLVASRLREYCHPMRWPLAELDDCPPMEMRDFAIAAAVFEVCHKTGLLATRNVATETPSACSIVAEVLREFGFDRGENLVEKVWRQHKLVDGGLIRRRVDKKLLSD